MFFILLLATVQSVKASPVSALPQNAVQIPLWNQQWNDMNTWLDSMSADSLASVPNAGITATSGSMIFNTTNVEDGYIDIYSEAFDLSAYTDVWFTVTYSIENLTENNGFGIWFGDSTLGVFKYTADAYLSGWYFASDTAPLENLTTINPASNSILEVKMHRVNDTGYVTTYLDGVVVDNKTGMDLGYDAIYETLNVMVDDSHANGASSDNIVVTFSDLGIYYEDDTPEATPTATPIQPPSGGVSGGSNPSNAPTQSPNAPPDNPNPTNKANNYSRRFYFPYLIVALILITGLGFLLFLGHRKKNKR